MSIPRRTQPHGRPSLWHELRESFGQEMIGLLLIAAGALLLLSLRGDDPSWLATMTGWTAPLAALSVLAVGLVLALGERAGFWSAEALVGAELLLLALMAGAFVRTHPEAAWAAQADGRQGGLVGWALGNLLVAALGQGLATLLLVLAGLLGLFLLARYTPLAYLVFYLGRAVPLLPETWAAVRDRLPAARPSAPLPSANFVSPEPPPDQATPGPQPAAPRRRPAAPALPSVQSAPQAPASAAQAPAAQPARPRKAPRSRSGPLPPLDLLAADGGPAAPVDTNAMVQRIEETLADFNVPVRAVHVETGPTVTQIGVEPLYLERGGTRRKIRVSKIASLADDLALALAAPAVRIEAPVPGRPFVGIEVPNPDKSLVSLRALMESREMSPERGALLLPLGRSTSGRPVIMDLARAPHLLIAGATGSGKSVCINTVITGLLMRHGPERLRFVMVDPKMVELPGYNGVPHLYGKVITDMDQVLGALTWLLLQMDDRYQLFRTAGVRNIDAYNEVARRDARHTPLPYIVLVIDELADLMMTAAEDVERQICRLAQMARATGIHLILATQRPSVDVVTGLIKANFPTRIAFAVTSQIDSRVILDQPGAERLLGRGDMLLMRSDAAKLARVQGAFVSDEEIGRVVHYWQAQAAGEQPAGEQADTGRPAVPPWNGLLARMEDEDELLNEAIDVLRGMQVCSTSMLQRKLRVGYPKAARLMEQLEAKRIVGPDLGGGQGRAVLLKKEGDEEGAEGEDGE